MAVVQEMTIRGATVRIHDDCYRGISAEENRRRRSEIDRVISQIWHGWAERKLAEQERATP